MAPRGDQAGLGSERKRLTCFKPPEYAVLRVMHRREPCDFGRKRDTEWVVAAPKVFVREPLGSRPQRLRRIEKEVDFGEPKAGAGLIATDGDREAGCREEPVVVLDSGADDTLNGELGEAEVASEGEGATALVALECEYGEMDHMLPLAGGGLLVVVVVVVAVVVEWERTR